MEFTKEFRDRFVKNLQGKDFILYGGLLDLAKKRGLKRIHTEIVQLPTKDNGNYAVVKAQIETEDGIYEEVGDAAPDSVNRAIAPHLLRMAATRAKARAMRDAVGVEMVALEELGEIVVGDEMPNETLSPEELVLSFGKYANRSLKEIMANDPKYIAWLRENARDPGIRSAAQRLMGEGGKEEVH